MSIYESESGTAKPEAVVAGAEAGTMVADASAKTGDGLLDDPERVRKVGLGLGALFCGLFLWSAVTGFHWESDPAPLAVPAHPVMPVMPTTTNAAGDIIFIPPGTQRGSTALNLVSADRLTLTDCLCAQAS